jgi:hypothetical protein
VSAGSPGRVPAAARVPLLALGGVALLAGLYGGVLLLGVAVPAPRPALPEVHGPVLVLGFVGTLVALERAVALRARWALAAPACSALGALVLVAAGPVLVGKVLLAAGGVGLLGGYLALWRRRPGVALLAQAAGAFAWYAAVLLWIAGLGIGETVPWLATFVVATIAGERLELAPVAAASRGAASPATESPAAASLAAASPAGRRADPEGWFLAALTLLVCGATAATLWSGVGGRLFGAGLLATVAWLARFDVARGTVRSAGLPRYVAVGLLTGYAWLTLAGLLWAGAGTTVDGPRYDASLHAVFLGFTISMIFVHAPVILPAVLRRPLPYHPVLYLPLALLHLSLLARVGIGDALSATAVWRWAGVANVLAVLVFVACAATLVARRRHPAPAGTGWRVPRAATARSAAPARNGSEVPL